MSDSAQHSLSSWTEGLPSDFTESELNSAPTLESVDDLLIEGLTDAEADAFYAALDA